MTTGKTNLTAAILEGNPVLESGKAAAVIVPVTPVQNNGSAGVAVATDAVAWSGELAIPRDDVGHGLSGVYATDSLAANSDAIGDEVRIAVLSKKEKFQSYADALSADLVIGDEVEILGGLFI